MPRKQTKKMGVGHVYRPRYVDRDGRIRESTIWWIKYHKRGRQQRESAKSDDKQVAMDLLRTRLSDIHHGRVSGPKVERTTYEDLETLIVEHYDRKNKNLRVLQVSRLPPLRAVFAGWLAKDMDEDAIARYASARKRMKKTVGGKFRRESDQNISGSTVNRELATLKRMFRLGLERGRVARIPLMEMYDEGNVRQGFVELADVEAAKKHVPGDCPSIKALIEIGFITGWRMDSELMKRRWTDVKFDTGEFRLPVGVAKDPDGRAFPLLPNLRKVIEAQLAYVKSIEQRENKKISYMFVRSDGRRIITCKKAIRRAFKDAGLPEFLPHDFRRSAVRSLELAGVPRPAAKKMVGHKTDSVYERYAIADKRMLDVGSAMLQTYLEAQEAKLKSENDNA